MKNLFLKHFDKILLILLAILGFSACEPMAEYGTPHADYEISGTVIDSLTSEPIPQIEVVLLDSIEYTDQDKTYPAHEYIRDTVFSDSSGKYLFKIKTMYSKDITFHLKTIDIDGATNKGDFKSNNTNVHISSSDWINKGDNDWYFGKAVKTIDIKLKKK